MVNPTTRILRYGVATLPMLLVVGSILFSLTQRLVMISHYNVQERGEAIINTVETSLASLNGKDGINGINGIATLMSTFTGDSNLGVFCTFKRISDITTLVNGPLNPGIDNTESTGGTVLNHCTDNDANGKCTYNCVSYDAAGKCIAIDDTSTNYLCSTLPKGPKNSKGVTGPPGIKGPDGTYHVQYVSETEYNEWTVKECTLGFPAVLLHWCYSDGTCLSPPSVLCNITGGYVVRGSSGSFTAGSDIANKYCDGKRGQTVQTCLTLRHTRACSNPNFCLQYSNAVNTTTRLARKVNCRYMCDKEILSPYPSEP